jgi:hypothetical protein
MGKNKLFSGAFLKLFSGAIDRKFIQIVHEVYKTFLI